MGFGDTIPNKILDSGVGNGGGFDENQAEKKTIEKQTVIDVVRAKGLENEEVKEMISAWTEQQQAVAEKDPTDRSRIQLCIDQGDLWSAAGKGSHALEALRDAEDQLIPVRDQFPDLADLVLEKGLAVKKEMYEISAEAAERECVAIAKELAESGEHLHFPGMLPEAYAEMKLTAEQFPEYTTPIDELIERFNTAGMKVDLNEGITSGNIYLVPTDTTYAYDDNLTPRHLQMAEGMDERLRNLILLYRARFTKE